jgi:hypothetical protein
VYLPSSLGIRVDEGVVYRIVSILSGKSKKSLYSLYTSKEGERTSICGKGTTDKIKKLYKSGQLKPYLDYLSEKVNEEKTLEPPVNVGATDCLASPLTIDVAMLKTLGVPAKKAPGILYEWRSLHSKGFHDICFLYKTFLEDLHERQIPFKKAEAIFHSELAAKIFNLGSTQQEAEVVRTSKRI